MRHNRYTLFGIAGSVLLLAACSQSPSDNASAGSAGAGAKPAPATQAAAVSDKCKDFPIPIYPSRTSLFCETGAGQPLSHTAYIESADSVDKVTQFYKTQVQSAGWTVDPYVHGEGTGRAVVSFKKGKGYGSAVLNPGMGGSGTRAQVHAYPNGN